MGDELDLLTPVVAPDRWHPNFGRIVALATPQERATLQDWARGFRDRDGKFVQEFQTTFNSSFWELYLYALLRDAGCSVDLSFDRPDFVVVDGPLGEFVAEAVVASHPASGMPEWAADLSEEPREREDLLDLAALRLAQALLEKHRKWNDGYGSLRQCASRPFIICVAPFEQPRGHVQGTQAIDRVLFGGPHPLFRIDEDGNAQVLGHSVFSAGFKPSGADVPFGMFTAPAFSAVSGVLFSSLATWSKVRALAPRSDRELIFHAIRLSYEHGLMNIVSDDGAYEETLVDGAHLFLNPYAARPVDPTPWRAIGIGIHRHQAEGTDSDVPDGALVHRVAYEVRLYEDEDEPVEPHTPPPGARHHLRNLPPDGVFFGGPSTVGLTDSAQLTLHRGWTILVARDVVDDDWNSVAKAGSYLSMQEFMDARPANMWMGEFASTRDEALQQARQQIDAALPGEEA